LARPRVSNRGVAHPGRDGAAPERVLRGTPASPGTACGTAWHLPEAIVMSEPLPEEGREQERDTALAALAAAAQALRAVAAALPPSEAEIVQTGALMARDPALARAIEQAILSDGVPAAEAINGATGEYADAIAAIGDERLAARADDVRSLGRRAARLASGRGMGAPPRSALILLARDVGPADVAELAPALAGVALAGGGATAHAAIVARSLGIPMLTGLGEEVLELSDGVPVVLDAESGSLIDRPSSQRVHLATAEMGARALAAQRAHDLRDRPAVTIDGSRITVLANVASAQELEVALRAGAEGIGLLRTELAFLDAPGWPSEQDHTDALKPILAGLGDLPAAVRVLDFGADKSPPFLTNVPERGLELLLSNPDALVAQLRAIVLAAQDHDVRILLPMVAAPEQVAHVRALIQTVARELGGRRIPPLGSMIETPNAAQCAAEIASGCEFLSIGTNDLTAATLGADRFAVNTARAHHPRVLRSIARSVTAAHEAGIPIEVCGEAASDPVMLPLLVGLGVDELSVAAAHVGEVRDWIRHLDAAESAGLARSALTMDDAEEVQWAARQLSAGLQESGAIPATR
jgi:phosphoenolpyruvate-protein kinase (PTS system EI component)